ncbi:MAG: glutamate synthase, partial [Jatrophihabitantaceae bacterium]|nr:glutamate synthase [Jatrophihabitantaceae bacterium]
MPAAEPKATSPIRTLPASLGRTSPGRTAAAFTAVPAASGLYDPSFEKDACGVAFLVDVQGRRSHSIVAQALVALHNMDHRGAAGAEENSGDGAGLLIQLPDDFLRTTFAADGIQLPAAGQYAAGIAFLPADDAHAATVVDLVAQAAADEGLAVLGWRQTPIDSSSLGELALSVMPQFRYLVLVPAESVSAAPAESAPIDLMNLERRAFCARKVAERLARDAGLELYFPSLSARTMVFKGMLTTGQLATFYPDLADASMSSAIALVHSRFSTNTFPSWPLAHPFRLIAHNGEINTVRGNRNWMRTREALVSSELLAACSAAADGVTDGGAPGDISRLFPICTPDASDSASFDEVLELLHMAGRSLPHAVLTMIPEAWENA